MSMNEPFRDIRFVFFFGLLLSCMIQFLFEIFVSQSSMVLLLDDVRLLS